MKIKAVVMLDVDWCDEDLGIPKEGDPLEERVLDSVEAAVWNALSLARENGFSHDLEAELSILPDYVRVEMMR